MDFQSYLKTAAEEINQELGKTLKKWSEEVSSVSPKLTKLNNEFIWANQGGKRLRGALIKLGYEMAGGKGKEILKPAAGIEIFHTAILAHDDIIDKASLRRGQPTLCNALGGDHRATSHTIVIGDIGFFLAVRLITDAEFATDQKNQALSAFTQMVIDTGLGEMLDIELPYISQKRSEKDVMAIHRLKTARYTIVHPLGLGVILAGGEQGLLKAVAHLGEALGIAFQIQDDILGVFGDEKTLGKSVTSDIEEGKNTLLIIHALEHADKKQQEILNKFYGKGKIGEKELESIRQVFIQTGALEYSKNKASALVKEAKAVIDKMKINKDKKQLLAQMADFLVQRSK